MSPPPPPPFCLPFGSKKNRRLSPSRTDFTEKTYSTRERGREYDPEYEESRSPYENDLRRSRSIGDDHSSHYAGSFKDSRASYSLTETVTSDLGSIPKRDPSPPPSQPRKRGWGYGWGLMKMRQKEKDKEMEKEMDISEKENDIEGARPVLARTRTLLSRKKTLPPPPQQEPYIPDADASSVTGFTVSNLGLSTVAPGSASGAQTPRPVRRKLEPIPDESPGESGGSVGQGPSRSNTQRSKDTGRSSRSRRSVSAGGEPSGMGSRVRYPPRRPPFSPADSQSTLVGSALDRKINEVSEQKEKVDTRERLEELRAKMAKDNLDYYVIPSEDAHGSEYVAPCDKRRQFISGFTGSSGQAIISKSGAYLVTDSRYWLQAEDELDGHWHLIRAPMVDGYKDWQSFLLERVGDGTRIGIDARMISWAVASVLNTAVQRKGAKLVFPTQNLVDLVWKTKPARSKEVINVHSRRFAGQDAESKIAQIRRWIGNHPPARPSYAKITTAPTDSERHVATLIANLSNIAWVLNLRGRDVPFTPVFHAYLFIGLDSAILFVDPAKVDESVRDHLDGLGVEVHEYNEVWQFLRRHSWGKGRVLISDDTSYAISLLLTHFWYTVDPSPSYVDSLKAIKNPTETEGLRNAYLRDGAAYVKWLAWLEDKLNSGYEITEWEAANRLTEYRRKNELFEGLAYENISASGKNAALPHYKATKGSAAVINKDTPYLNDSGAQYRDGTIDTTRTVHFGVPTVEQCEAFTRVLQGHIAIDSAYFPEGTSGNKLDVLARRALWKEGLNYLHGTGHGFGSYLAVHEGPQGFSSDVHLVPGHVVTNEPGFYNDGKWGIRIESALLVRKVTTKHEYQGPVWLGFERLTVVPIQTKMVKVDLLSKEEIMWIKEHNRLCFQKLEPLIREDKRALKWMKREAERGIGIASPGPGGMTVVWD